MRTVTFIVAISALSAAGSARGESLSQEKALKIRTLFQEALSLYQKKEYARSNEAFQQILTLLPKPKDSPQDQGHANVHYNMTLNYALLGKKKEALESLEKAIASGFWRHDYLARDPTLKDLRGEKEFEALLDRARRALPEIAFGLKDITGKEILKKDYEGKVLIVDVWGTWCGPCRKEIPSFIKLQEKYGDQGLRVLGLTWERQAPDENVRARVEAFAKAEKINYPLALISEGLFRSIPDFEGFPTTLLIGRDGLLATRINGAEDYASLEARVLPLLAKRAPAPAPAPDP